MKTENPDFDVTRIELSYTVKAANESNNSSTGDIISKEQQKNLNEEVCFDLQSKDVVISIECLCHHKSSISTTVESESESSVVATRYLATFDGKETSDDIEMRCEIQGNNEKEAAGSAVEEEGGVHQSISLRIKVKNIARSECDKYLNEMKQKNAILNLFYFVY